MEIQAALGSDIRMVLDECTEYPAGEVAARKSMERTLRWAGRSREAWQKIAEQGTETVALTGKTRELPGIPVSELSRDQKEHVHLVMNDLLAPFRKQDVDEAMKLITSNGFDNLHMTFYKNEDIGNDGVWDIWQIEGPAMIWYFRGAPHVHTWVHIRQKA